MRSFFSWLPLASGFLVLVLAMVVAVLTVTSRNNASNLASSQDIRTSAAESAAVLSLSPATGDFSLSSGATIPVGIVVDSAGKSIDGVDVIMSFDPTRVTVVSPQVTPTGLFEESPLNQIDNTAGTIRFSALTFNAKPAAGIVGTFAFKPKVAGEITFTFAFTPGATTDSNVADHQSAKDILGKVENGRYNFK